MKFYLPIVFVLLLFVGCKNDVSHSDDMVDPIPLNYDVHVAFAGGGWRAHTAHSAWTIALLDKGSLSLDYAFSNVKTISSNSGGSWFSTMLLYSNTFVSNIQTSNANTTWMSTGWLGQQRQHFNSSFLCNHTPSEYLYLECVFDKYTGKDITGGTYWRLMVDKLVFRDYSLGDQTLSSPRQSWATNKSLLLASTLLKNSVVLNKLDSWEHPNTMRYYQACLNDNLPYMNGDKGSNCGSAVPIVDVTPVTFSSLSSTSGLLSPAFLSDLSFNVHSNSLVLGYTKDKKGSKVYTEHLALPLHNNNVKVMNAAAASSAALGFGASERISGSFDVAYGLSDDAITFSLNNSAVKYVPADAMDLADLASNKVVRLADGGAVDNAAVAQLVRFLQLNQEDKGFNIVAFDNVMSTYSPKSGGADVGVDIATLFGYKEDLCETVMSKTFCLKIPDLQIFDGIAMDTTTATWISPDTTGNKLVYTKYSVNTKYNKAMGITTGSYGTLHSFTGVFPNADTAPMRGSTDFDYYDDMFQFIQTELNKNGGEGLSYLETALGL